MTASPFLDEILVRARRGMGRTSLARSVPSTRGQRIWKSLSANSSAFVKRIRAGGTHHGKQLAGQLAYVNGKSQGMFGNVPGFDFEKDELSAQDMATFVANWADEWKGRPRNGHTSHIVLSFPDDVPPSIALAVGQEWCAEMFEHGVHSDDTWEYVAALHTDTDNPHVHVILNNRGDNGTWFAMYEGADFSPQMMRDRQVEIAEDFGVYLESLTREDKGLYEKPVSNEDFWKEPKLQGEERNEERRAPGQSWQDAERAETAELYQVLGDFAAMIGAPVIAGKAYINASRLSAGKETVRGDIVDITLDIAASRDDLRKSLISWVEQNEAVIEELPEVDQQAVHRQINAALEIIETDTDPVLTEGSLWHGHTERPSQYLVHDGAALEARALQYVDEEDTDLMHDFITSNALDRYLVTGAVPEKFKAVMPAVSEAYREMHHQKLEAVPKLMKGYVEKAAALGLDRAQVEERLISAIDDPVEAAKIEREDIARIVKQRGDGLETASRAQFAYDAALSRANEIVTDEEDEQGEALRATASALSVIDAAKGRGEEAQSAYAELGRNVAFLQSLKENNEMNGVTREIYDGLALRIYSDHGAAMSKAVELHSDEQSTQEVARELAALSRGQIENPSPLVAAYREAAEVYRDLQDDLADIERKAFENTRIVNPDGLAEAMNQVADRAYSTNSPDFENSTVSREMLEGFVAREGRGAMREIAGGDVSSLQDYVELPAKQRLVAKELLRAAKTVDVGLEAEEIEQGLEAIDPNYRGREGISL